VLLAAAALAALALAACATPGRAANGGFTIGLLLPSTQSARYESDDRPLIVARVKQLCPACSVRYANAELDVATQEQQMRAMITNGVRVVIADPVDARSFRSSVVAAHDAHIPVVAYDRLAAGPISGYVSFDGVEEGRLQGRALLSGLDAAAGHSGQARIVMINGAPTDPNAGLFKKGALEVLQGRVVIARSYDAPGWREEEAYQDMSGALDALGPGSVDGVYAANDNLAAGAIAALVAARVAPLPPVVGGDAELPAVQRIVGGQQYMTVYKPYRPEAEAAAAMALALGRGGSVARIATTRVANDTEVGIPAVLLTPSSVTAGTLRSTVVAGGRYTVDQICTPPLRAACARAGLGTP
jgi:D-xylose transport system substrate-binding protein